MYVATASCLEYSNRLYVRQMEKHSESVTSRQVAIAVCTEFRMSISHKLHLLPVSEPNCAFKLGLEGPSQLCNLFTVTHEWSSGSSLLQVPTVVLVAVVLRAFPTKLRTH